MLTLLVILILGGIMLFGFGAIAMFFGWAFFGDSWKKKAEQKYQTELPQKFNGNDTVVWEISLTDSGVPKKQQLIEDASNRGYALENASTNKVNQTLVFVKRDATSTKSASSQVGEKN